MAFFHLVIACFFTCAYASDHVVASYPYRSKSGTLSFPVSYLADNGFVREELLKNFLQTVFANSALSTVFNTEFNVREMVAEKSFSAGSPPLFSIEPLMMIMHMCSRD